MICVCVIHRFGGERWFRKALRLRRIWTAFTVFRLHWQRMSLLKLHGSAVSQKDDSEHLFGEPAVVDS